jgi:hypothetical protein
LQKTITTPFEDAADEFVRTTAEEGMVLDTSAMEELPTKQDAEYARRLRLNDDATFATRNSAAMSRVTNPTMNTSGAESFRSTNTTDMRRDFRATCLQRAIE